MFDIEFFREDPKPFYVLAHELYPGRFHPTVSHAFVALLARRGLLRMLFTQNIDCLERAAGVPPHLIVEAHGSFATQRCIDCKAPFPDDAMREAVDKEEPPICRDGCGTGLVKPDIVFFGEALPENFHANTRVPALADLVLVLGTSLMVAPFSSLPRFAGQGVPRVLFNIERVGDMGTRADDVLCLGDCDSGVRRLADALGWRDDLETLWTGVVGEEEAQRQRARNEDGGRGRAEEQKRELDKLAEGVEAMLAISTPNDEDGKETDKAQANDNLPAGIQDDDAKAVVGEEADEERRKEAAAGDGPDPGSTLGGGQSPPTTRDASASPAATTTAAAGDAGGEAAGEQAKTVAGDSPAGGEKDVADPSHAASKEATVATEDKVNPGSAEGGDGGGTGTGGGPVL